LLLLKKGGRTVYFGKIGPNSQDVIDYFERNGAAKCLPDDNPAEYILQVIGAGATVKVDRDWGDVWDGTLDGQQAITETAALKTEYQELESTDEPEELDQTFAAPWFTQYRAVQSRAFQIYWRSPTYIYSKITLNVAAGLFLGFTFWKEEESVQDMQNKVRDSSVKSIIISNDIAFCYLHGRHSRNATYEPTSTKVGSAYHSLFSPREAIKGISLVHLRPLQYPSRIPLQHRGRDTFLRRLVLSGRILEAIQWHGNGQQGNLPVANDHDIRTVVEYIWASNCCTHS
jgi:hypothetical protein